MFVKYNFFFAVYWIDYAFTLPIPLIYEIMSCLRRAGLILKPYQLYPLQLKCWIGLLRLTSCMPKWSDMILMIHQWQRNYRALCLINNKNLHIYNGIWLEHAVSYNFNIVFLLWQLAKFVWRCLDSLSVKLSAKVSNPITWRRYNCELQWYLYIWPRHFR